MTKPMPDTDPLKREPPGELGRVPDNDVGEAGRPGGKPAPAEFPETGDKHRPTQPRGDEPHNE